MQRLSLARRCAIDVRLYAAHTTGARNRATLRRHGFGMLGSAAYRWTDPEWSAVDAGGLGWALDNGAWGAFTAGKPFDGEAFRRAVGESGRVDFVVCPDVVADADGTRAMIEAWLPWTVANADAARVLLPVQNGMEYDQIEWSESIGVFVGGDSAWKDATIGLWAARARAAGAYCHVGRVNTAARLDLCVYHGVDSCDGSGAAIYSIHAEKMAGWRDAASRQQRLFRGDR